MKKLSIIIFCISLLSCGSVAHRQSPTPIPSTQAGSVRIDTIELFDIARNRPVPVAVYRPAIANAPLPCIVFSHGYGYNIPKKNITYSYLTEALARNGYAVLSIQHELTGDDSLAFTGNLRLLRRPNWERGSDNIHFALRTIHNIFPDIIATPVSLIGHSNGGDISIFYAEKYPDEVEKVITMDNLRLPVTKTATPKMYSLRSSDRKADEGVLPTPEEQQKFDITIISLPATTHLEMDNNANPSQREEIIRHILRFLTDK